MQPEQESWEWVQKETRLSRNRRFHLGMDRDAMARASLASLVQHPPTVPTPVCSCRALRAACVSPRPALVHLHSSCCAVARQFVRSSRWLIASPSMGIRRGHDRLHSLQLPPLSALPKPCPSPWPPSWCTCSTWFRCPASPQAGREHLALDWLATLLELLRNRGLSPRPLAGSTADGS
jgi:hypothetical protein